MGRDARAVLLVAHGIGPAASPAVAERISDIRNNLHNLSVTEPDEEPDERVVKATEEDELCVFCHTPHGASKGVKPLWNRDLSGVTNYAPYTSSSLDAIGIGQPGGTSKLCLSCHDGTIAIGSVNVLNGAAADITMAGTDPHGTMPAGAGASPGFTRRLGTDLTNAPPISFTYDDALAVKDGELRLPSDTPEIDNRVPGVRPEVPLIDDQLQCTACHDPHIRDTIEANIKFLRLNRLQKDEPLEGVFTASRDQI